MNISYKAQVSIFVVIALLIVGSIILMVTVRTNTNNGNSYCNDNYAECFSDNDCLRVQTSCCSCNMGGEEVCVVKEKANLYQINQNECSPDLICTASYNCKEESCGCTNGKCVWKRY